MEQSLVGWGDGKELKDNKLGVYIWGSADYGPPKYAVNVYYGH